MNTAQVVSLLFGSGILFSIGGFLVGKLKSVKAIKLGLQALLRDTLLERYNHYKKKGYAPIYARDNFENLYNQYHSLGANGVMDDVRKDFFKLPTEPPAESMK